MNEQQRSFLYMSTILGLYGGMPEHISRGSHKPKEFKRCIMCGEPRKDGLFCDGSKPLLSGKSCKETYRSEPDYWDKKCKY
jgi:hypothetical protein